MSSHDDLASTDGAFPPEVQAVRSVLGSPSGYYFGMEGIAAGKGFGSNAVQLSMGEDLYLEMYDLGRKRDVAGLVRFYLDFDDDLEYFMPYDVFRKFLQDVARRFIRDHPDERAEAQRALELAIETVRSLEAASS